MPRRSILSAAERAALLAIPGNTEDLIRLYAFNDADLALIRQHRGPANRLGFAVQLCYLRFPGIVLEQGKRPFPPLLKIAAEQLKVAPALWDDYGRRDETRREHLQELQAAHGFRPFSAEHYDLTVDHLSELAGQTDRGFVLAEGMLASLRKQHVLLPSMKVIERICAEALTRANRPIYATLTDPLSKAHRQRLEDGSGANWAAARIRTLRLHRSDSDIDHAASAARQISGSVARRPPSLPNLNCPFLIFSASSIPLITTSAVLKLFSPNIGRNRCLILR